jgi:hypothetical protein
VDDEGGCIALCQFVNVAPLCCECVNSMIASVVCLGGCCVRVGGVEVLDQMEGHGGGGGVTGVRSLGWHQRLRWGRCPGCRLNDC